MNRLNVTWGIAAAFVVAEVRAMAADPVQWRTDFTAAAIEAQKQNKPLFITISTEWCGPCREMHRTTLHEPSVVELLNSRCVPLLLDGDKEKERMNQWRISEYPTTMIVGTSGAVKTQVLERLVGKMSAAELRSALQRAIQKQESTGVAAGSKRPVEVKPVGAAAKESEGRSASRGPINPPSPSEAEGTVKQIGYKTSDPLSPPETSPKPALDGHCPVCMIERAEMVAGKAAESHVYNGRKYLFSSAENKRKFMESPAKYLPGAGGDCVVTLVEKGKHVAGDTKYPAMFADKVFFLSDKASRDKFLKDPEAFVDAKGEPRASKNK